MAPFASPGILLRAIDHGDYDRIVTFFTRDRGKISMIAKSAKKSARRFAGVLELFADLELVWGLGRGRGLPVLQEASVIRPFDRIRTTIAGTAFASCWCELVYEWMEPGQRQVPVYDLLRYCLGRLDDGRSPNETLHVVFQLRFMAEAGFRPGLEACNVCGKLLETFKRSAVTFDAKRGGIACETCGAGQLTLSKGTVKLLQRVLNWPVARLDRLRFSDPSMAESLRVLEVFVPYHLGKETKSARFLKQILKSLPN